MHGSLHPLYSVLQAVSFDGVVPDKAAIIMTTIITTLKVAQDIPRPRLGCSGLRIDLHNIVVVVVILPPATEKEQHTLFPFFSETSANNFQQISARCVLICVQILFGPRMQPIAPSGIDTNTSALAS